MSHGTTLTGAILHSLWVMCGHLSASDLTIRGETLSGLRAAFQKYDVLSVRDRKAVVDKAIQEVLAVTASPSAHSRDGLASISSTATAASGGLELRQFRQQPVSKVSSLKNLVGGGSKHGRAAADDQDMQTSAASLLHGAQPPGKHQQAAQVSQRNRGIRLMTAEGPPSAAQLLSVADLAAASTEPRNHKHPVSRSQPVLHPGDSQTAAAPQSHKGVRHLEASGSGPLPSIAELARPAVLVGEDEEFSVDSGGLSNARHLFQRV